MPKGDKLKLKADPDDGTTPIANLLLEAVAISKLSGTEKGIILYLWRETYGWVEDGKRLKEAQFSQATLATDMGISERAAYTCLKRLTNTKVLLRKDLGQGKGYIYQMNTNVASWNSGTINRQVLRKLARLDETCEGNIVMLPKHKTSTPEGVVGGTNMLPPPNINMLPPYQLYKEILNKPFKEILSRSMPEQSFWLANHLKTLILGNNPGAKTPEDLTKWAKEIEHMLTIDKRTCLNTIEVMEFCQKDPFWMANILSTSSFREKFDQLYLKMRGASATKQPRLISPSDPNFDAENEACKKSWEVKK